MFAFRNVNNWPNPVMGNSWGSLVDCNYWSPQQRQVPKLRRYNNRCYNLDDFHWMSNDSIVWSIHMWKTNEMMSWGVMPILNEYFKASRIHQPCSTVFICIEYQSCFFQIVVDPRLNLLIIRIKQSSFKFV